MKALKGFRRSYLREVIWDYVWGIKSRQNPYEIFNFLSDYSRLKPKIVVEIGTASGGTLFLLHQIVDRNAVVISIDLPLGQFGGGYPIWKKLLFKSFMNGNQKQYLLMRDSHNIKTLDRVLKILGGKKINLLFIDGDHTYNGVKKDFEMYSPLVDGIIVFHDINPHPDVRYGVSSFWDETKRHYNFNEIIDSPDTPGLGILYYER